MAGSDECAIVAPNLPFVREDLRRADPASTAQNAVIVSRHILARVPTGDHPDHRTARRASLDNTPLDAALRI